MTMYGGRFFWGGWEWVMGTGYKYKDGRSYYQKKRKQKIGQDLY